MAFLDVADYRLEPEYCRCDRHGDDCTCEHCHEHKEHRWQDWNGTILCEFCQMDKVRDAEVA